MVWTYVSIVGHGLNASLVELCHGVVWMLLPILFPQSFLLEVFPGSLPLDQGDPKQRNKKKESSEWTDV